jgi:hypothetical protein
MERKIKIFDLEKWKTQIATRIKKQSEVVSQ